MGTKHPYDISSSPKMFIYIHIETTNRCVPLLQIFHILRFFIFTRVISKFMVVANTFYVYGPECVILIWNERIFPSYEMEVISKKKNVCSCYTREQLWMNGQNRIHCIKCKLPSRRDAKWKIIFHLYDETDSVECTIISFQ